MTAPHIVDPAGLLVEALGEASPDLMRHLLQTVINALLSADVDAVVADRGYQRIEPPKDYEHRSIPIPAFLVGLLRAQIAGRDANAPVFYGIRTGTWLRNHVYRVGWFDGAATAIGLGGLTPHELRHTAASLAGDGDAPEPRPR